MHEERIDISITLPPISATYNLHKRTLYRSLISNNVVKNRMHGSMLHDTTPSFGLCQLFNDKISQIEINMAVKH